MSYRYSLLPLFDDRFFHHPGQVELLMASGAEGKSCPRPPDMTCDCLRGQSWRLLLMMTTMMEEKQSKAEQNSWREFWFLREKDRQKVTRGKVFFFSWLALFSPLSLLIVIISTLFRLRSNRGSFWGQTDSAKDPAKDIFTLEELKVGLCHS